VSDQRDIDSIVASGVAAEVGEEIGATVAVTYDDRTRVFTFAAEGYPPFELSRAAIAGPPSRNLAFMVRHAFGASDPAVTPDAPPLPAADTFRDTYTWRLQQICTSLTAAVDATWNYSDVRNYLTPLLDMAKNELKRRETTMGYNDNPADLG
jgi:hypothetical protein